MNWKGIGPHRAWTVYILFRIWLIFTLPVVIFVWASDGNVIGYTMGWGGFVAFCMSWSLPIASVGMRIVGPFAYRDEWHYFVQSGGRPLLDVLPWPFNPRSLTVRMGGLPEPRYKSFVPPPSWEYQCRCCGARVELERVICWYCNANWIDGNGAGSTFAPHRGKAAAIDQAVPRNLALDQSAADKNTMISESANDVPVIHHDDNGQPFCIEDGSGKMYWFYEDGKIFYLKEHEVSLGDQHRSTPSDPSLVPMNPNRR